MWPIWPSWRLARHPGDKSDGWAETRVSLDMILPGCEPSGGNNFHGMGGQAAGESRLWLAGRLARDMPGTGEARTTYLMNGCPDCCHSSRLMTTAVVFVNPNSARDCAARDARFPL